jgi:hypothetical protein
MSEDLDPVEWEMVRADIAMEKARLRANGDWAKWEAFQAQSNSRFAAFSASADRLSRAARSGRPVADEERFALWSALRTPDLSFLMAPLRSFRRFSGPPR